MLIYLRLFSFILHLTFFIKNRFFNEQIALLKMHFYQLFSNIDGKISAIFVRHCKIKLIIFTFLIGSIFLYMFKNTFSFCIFSNVKRALKKETLESHCIWKHKYVINSMFEWEAWSSVLQYISSFINIFEGRNR